MKKLQQEKTPILASPLKSAQIVVRITSRLAGFLYYLYISRNGFTRQNTVVSLYQVPGASGHLGRIDYGQLGRPGGLVSAAALLVGPQDHPCDLLLLSLPVRLQGTQIPIEPPDSAEVCDSGEYSLHGLVRGSRRDTSALCGGENRAIL